MFNIPTELIVVLCIGIVLAITIKLGKCKEYEKYSCSISNQRNSGSPGHPKNYSTDPNFVNTVGWSGNGYINPITGYPSKERNYYHNLHGDSYVLFGNPYKPYDSPWASDSPCGGCNENEECKLMRYQNPPYNVTNSEIGFGVKGVNVWQCVPKSIDLPFEDCNQCDHFSDVMSYYTVDRTSPPKLGCVSKHWS